MRVGIDFDNTIAKYDRIFIEAAKAYGWVATDFQGTKREVRDQVRLLADGEVKWQMLQGEVYGIRMEQATPFDGVIDFFRAARERDAELFIISHKTRHSAYDPHHLDLREAALRWLEARRFFDPRGLGLRRDRVIFADTRSEKIERIRSFGCEIFIDDLSEVFADPAFPPGIARILFSTSSEPVPAHKVVACCSWEEISRHVFGEEAAKRTPLPDDLLAAAGRLAGSPVHSVRPTRPGGNNKLYRVKTGEGRVVALKAYPRLADDSRDRPGTEFKALEFMWRRGLRQVPRPVAVDAEGGYLLCEWIDGVAAPADSASLAAVLAFLCALHDARSSADADSLPLASEACLSADEIVAQIDRRLATLAAVAGEHPDLRVFLRDRFRHTREHAVAQAKLDYGRAGLAFDADLDRRFRTLSPSDFGLHNALARPDGSVAFVDFEYFGWDDPVKLSCDFVLHPGMDLTAAMRQEFLSGVSDIFGADASFPRRLHACLPLYALRWTTILLNEFLPDRWLRRRAAGLGDERSAVLSRQLDKARAMLARVVPASERIES
jgi:hypothetical protein